MSYLITVFDLTYSLFHFFLFVVTLLVLFAILRLFIKKTVPLLLTFLLFIITGAAAFEFSHRTTFASVVPDGTADPDNVESITVTDLDEEEGVHYAEIEESEVIEDILDHFSGLNLREQQRSRPEDLQYLVQIHSEENYSFHLTENQLDGRLVISEENHLKKLDQLRDNNDLQWEEF
ncbi:hypothetical protein [Alkalicoccus saliphilus]|uniref:Uncharacterized protein n=1 Tax=Alkalicoccus saliphilus TaxID=200989 RepID=A0A2T4U708_9BACI|nr:hypothetical protein [Alkalicoccus saliphilus]PTL39188.1 hypothetical protein C6Y45_07290 [Alkalicoccus saliphilus]